jgi:hypothetical protein
MAYELPAEPGLPSLALIAGLVSSVVILSGE